MIRIVFFILMFAVQSALACGVYRSDFAIKGDEVLHKSTGLVWKRCPLGYKLDATQAPERCVFSEVNPADPGGSPIFDSIVFNTFDNALRVVNDLPGNWRLPNEREVASILDLCTDKAFLLSDVEFPILDEFAVANFLPYVRMLTANATEARLFQESAGLFDTSSETTGQLGARALVYPVKSAPALQR